MYKTDIFRMRISPKKKEVYKALAKSMKTDLSKLIEQLLEEELKKNRIKVNKILEMEGVQNDSKKN